jgi:hypothetical protein
MKMQKRNIVVGVMILAVIALYPIVTMAGNLEPSGPPTTGTMRTLDDIYNKTNNAMTLPKPEDVTIISKTASFSGTTTLFTVTSGKTFYLMGLAGNGLNISSLTPFDLILAEGATTTKIMHFNLTDLIFDIISCYPMAVFPSGSEIRASATGAGVSINIWGYEK